MYVVTSTDLGWDCVVAVYPDTVDIKLLEQAYPDNNSYVIHQESLGTLEDVLNQIEEIEEIEENEEDLEI